MYFLRPLILSSSLRVPVLLAGLAGLLGGCKPTEKDRLPNQTPGTEVSIKDIELASPSNLVSRVRLFWSGTDADGFVAGYQISVNQGPWSPILQRTDSLFRFTFDNGSLTTSISFRVRSIDNVGAADPEPALIVLPIRNTPPTAAFTSSLLPIRDTVLAVLTIPFTFADKDGQETLDSGEVRLNGGPWYRVPATATSVSLLALDPRMPGTQDARVYLPQGQGTILAPRTIPGLLVNGNNTVEVRARDRAGAIGITTQLLRDTVTQRTFYVRAQSSDLLVLDGYAGNASPTPETFYNPALQQVYPQGVDKLDLLSNGAADLPRSPVTMSLLINLYNKIFYYGDDNRGANVLDNTSLLIETLAGVLQGYLSRPDHHLLLSNRLPDGAARLPRDSRFFGLAPADSVSAASGGIRLVRNSPATAYQPGYPDLQVLSQAQGINVISGIDVFYPNAQADTLYKLPTATNSTGPVPSRVIAASRSANGKPVLIFFAMDLHLLAGNNVAFRDFFDKVLNQDFN